MPIKKIAVTSKSFTLTHPKYPKAYVSIDCSFVWNKGTEYEKVLPTLDMIEVPKRFRGKGVGKELLTLVLEKLKKLHIPLVAFDNFDSAFWDSVDRAFPGLLYWPIKRGSSKKRFGVLVIDKNADYSNFLST